MNSSAPPRDWLIRWPASRFFFDVIDVGTARKPVNSQELAYRFETSLPVPTESVHAIFHSLGDGRILACAVKRSALDELPDGALALIPDASPAFLVSRDRDDSGPGGSTANIDPDRLNLLVGEFAPAPVRRLRQRRTWFTWASVVAVCAALVFGMDRRIRAANRVAGSAETEEAATLHQVLGPAPPTVPTVQRRMALIAERRRLERTRVTRLNTDLPDVSLFLAAVLAEWPDGPDVRIEHLGTTSSAVTVRGNTAESNHAQQLADRLGRVPGFSVDQPQFSTARGRVSFTIRLRRIGGSSP